MEDPLSSVHDRPHRYLLDSDSEDEEGQGLYPPSDSGPSRLSKIKISSRPATKVSITTNGPYEEVVLGIGQAGKYISRKFGGEGVVEVRVGDEVVGKGGVVGGRLILGVDDESVGDLHALAGELLKVETKSWMIVSTYLPSLYIPDRPFSAPTAPIRVLSIENGKKVEKGLKGVEAITSPNYVTGLAAALLSKLIHPTSPNLTASLLFLPLPLSSIPNQELLNVLSQISQTKTEFKLSTQGRSWTEDDDEPFMQLGMGLGGGKNRDGKADKRELDGMYM